MMVSSSVGDSVMLVSILSVGCDSSILIVNMIIGMLIRCVVMLCVL